MSKGRRRHKTVTKNTYFSFIACLCLCQSPSVCQCWIYLFVILSTITMEMIMIIMIMIRLHINVCILYFQWSTITVAAVPPLVLWPPTTNSTNSTRPPTSLKLCTKYSCWLQCIIFFQHLRPVQLVCSSEQQAGSLNSDTFRYESSHTNRREAPFSHSLSWRQSYRQSKFKMCKRMPWNICNVKG